MHLDLHKHVVVFAHRVPVLGVRVGVPPHADERAALNSLQPTVVEEELVVVIVDGADRREEAKRHAFLLALHVGVLKGAEREMWDDACNDEGQVLRVDPVLDRAAVKHLRAFCPGRNGQLALCGDALLCLRHPVVHAGLLSGPARRNGTCGQ